MCQRKLEENVSTKLSEACLSDLQLDSLLQVLVSLLDQLFGPQDSVPHEVFGATTADLDIRRQCSGFL